MRPLLGAGNQSDGCDAQFMLQGRDIMSQSTDSADITASVPTVSLGERKVWRALFTLWQSAYSFKKHFSLS